MANGFDISVVDLQNVVIRPGHSLKVVLTDEESKQEMVLAFWIAPRWNVEDDGTEGKEPGMPWIAQFGAEPKFWIEERLRKNQIRFVYTAGGEIKLRVEPRAEKGGD